MLHAMLSAADDYATSRSAFPWSTHFVSGLCRRCLVVGRSFCPTFGRDQCFHLSFGKSYKLRLYVSTSSLSQRGSPSQNQRLPRWERQCIAVSTHYRHPKKPTGSHGYPHSRHCV